MANDLNLSQHTFAFARQDVVLAISEMIEKHIEGSLNNGQSIG